MDNYENPIPGKTYISQRIDAFGDPQRKVRIATKLIEHSQAYAFAEIPRTTGSSNARRKRSRNIL